VRGEMWEEGGMRGEGERWGEGLEGNC